MAKLLDGTVEGDPETLITHPSKIEEASSGSICFLGNPKYEPYLYQTEASAVLVDRAFQPSEKVRPALIRVENVYLSVSKLLEEFEIKSNYTGIHSTAIIHESAHVGENVSIGAYAVIGEGVHIGNGTRIYPQVYLDRNVRIGEQVIIHSGVKIYKDCIVGNRCILHSNVVIGSDGFGFSPDSDGNYKKIPQLGNVELGNDVEIGSNTSIDRGTMGSTRIGDGSKLDNLIQIAHNVQIGNRTVIAAQTGIAGSTKIGSNCQIGGQVGIAGHLSIADGSQIQAQSGIASSLDTPNGKWYGSPAIEYLSFLRAYSEFKSLPSLSKRIKKLEDRNKSES